MHTGNIKQFTGALNVKRPPHLPLLMLCQEGAVEVLQRQFGHSHSLPRVVAHGERRCHASRHGQTILQRQEAGFQSTTALPMKLFVSCTHQALWGTTKHLLMHVIIQSAKYPDMYTHTHTDTLTHTDTHSTTGTQWKQPGGDTNSTNRLYSHYTDIITNDVGYVTSQQFINNNNWDAELLLLSSKRIILCNIMVTVRSSVLDAYLTLWQNSLEIRPQEPWTPPICSGDDSAG